MSPSLARGFQDNMNYWLIIANNASLVDTIQDFLCKLGIKPHLHLVDTIVSSLHHVIVRATKIIKDLLKDRKIWIFKVLFQCCKSPESF